MSINSNYCFGNQSSRFFQRSDKSGIVGMHYGNIEHEYLGEITSRFKYA